MKGSVSGDGLRHHESEPRLQREPKRSTLGQPSIVNDAQKVPSGGMLSWTGHFLDSGVPSWALRLLRLAGVGMSAMLGAMRKQAKAAGKGGSTRKSKHVKMADKFRAIADAIVEGALIDSSRVSDILSALDKAVKVDADQMLSELKQVAIDAAMDDSDGDVEEPKEPTLKSLLVPKQTTAEKMDRIIEMMAEQGDRDALDMLELHLDLVFNKDLSVDPKVATTDVSEAITAHKHAKMHVNLVLFELGRRVQHVFNLVRGGKTFAKMCTENKWTYRTARRAREWFAICNTFPVLLHIKVSTQFIVDNKKQFNAAYNRFLFNHPGSTFSAHAANVAIKTTDRVVAMPDPQPASNIFTLPGVEDGRLPGIEIDGSRMTSESGVERDGFPTLTAEQQEEIVCINFGDLRRQFGEELTEEQARQALDPTIPDEVLSEVAQHYREYHRATVPPLPYVHVAAVNPTYDNAGGPAAEESADMSEDESSYGDVSPLFNFTVTVWSQNNKVYVKIPIEGDDWEHKGEGIAIAVVDYVKDIVTWKPTKKLLESQPENWRLVKKDKTSVKQVKRNEYYDLHYCADSMEAAAEALDLVGPKPPAPTDRVAVLESKVDEMSSMMGEMMKMLKQLTSKRPPGRAPKGKKWDPLADERGAYVEAEPEPERPRPSLEVESAVEPAADAAGEVC